MPACDDDAALPAAERPEDAVAAVSAGSRVPGRRSRLCVVVGSWQRGVVIRRRHAQIAAGDFG